MIQGPTRIVVDVQGVGKDSLDALLEFHQGKRTVLLVGQPGENGAGIHLGYGDVLEGVIVTDALPRDEELAKLAQHFEERAQDTEGLGAAHYLGPADRGSLQGQALAFREAKAAVYRLMTQSKD